MNKLGDRAYGFEFSGIEYELIFKQDDMGFVRYDGKSKSKFYLDPSPFLQSQEKQVYVIEGCPPPGKRKLIRVLSMNTDEVITGIIKGKVGNFDKTKIKYVRSWEYVNPNKIFRRKLIDYDEFTSFFEQPFSSKHFEHMLEPHAKTMAIYSASSPIIGSNLKGGISSSVITGDYQPLWDHTAHLLNFIPTEFKNVRSETYYKYGNQEEAINPYGCAEVSLAYNNAEQLVTQIPVNLIKFEVKGKNNYKENYNYMLPFMKAYQLDSLLFTPELPKSLEKYMEESIYILKERVEANVDSLAYNQDVGMALPKVSASLARLHFVDEITKAHIKEANETWFDSFEHAVYMERICMHSHDVMRLHRYNAGSKTLYFYLLDKYSSGVKIPKAEIYENCPIAEYLLEDTIANLLEVGAAYSPDKDHIKLLDFRPPEWK